MKKTNYGDLPKEYSSLDKSKVVIIPVPYDGTSTWIKGADKGPDAILEASANMELYDIETDSDICNVGIFTDVPVTEKSSPEKMTEAVKDRVLNHLSKDKFVVLLGGEHSISVGSFLAHAKKFKDLTILQLDAHADLRPEYENSKYNHACAMSRGKEISPIVQVGIRSMSADEIDEIDRSVVFFAEDIFSDKKEYKNKKWMDKAISKLSKKVYITIDLDVFDPSIMPSTGTPEPGGLLWYDVLDLMRKVCKERDVVGFDIVELCPNEVNKTPNFLASKLIYKILGYKFFGDKIK
jgi:agmatinase